MPLATKQTGAIKNIPGFKTKVAGAWKNGAQAFTKVAGEWIAMLLAGGFDFAGKGPTVVENGDYKPMPGGYGTKNSLVFKPDGTRLITSAGDEFLHYDLSTPWDVSTAGPVTWRGLSATYASNVQSMCAGDNGRLLITADPTKDYITAFRLSTPWDVSTTNTTAESRFYIGGAESQPYGVYISPDGTRLFTTGRQRDSVRQYNLSTPWNLNTASYISELATPECPNHMGVTFTDDGLFMFLAVDNKYELFGYRLSTAWELSTAQYDGAVGWSDNGYEGKDLHYAAATGELLALSNNGVNSFTLGTPLKTGNLAEATLLGTVDLGQIWLGLQQISPDQTYLYGPYILATSLFFQYKMTTPGDVTTAVADGSLNATDLGMDRRSFAIKPDGTKAYFCASTVLHQFTLTTPWDITTATADGVSVDLAQQTDAMTFSGDGLRLYAANQNGMVYEYALTTPFGLSTLSATGNTLDTSVDGAFVNGITISGNGEILLVPDANQSVVQYNLATAFDLSTATFTIKYKFDEDSAGNFRAWAFNPKGTEFYAANTGGILNKYATPVLEE